MKPRVYLAGALVVLCSIGAFAQEPTDKKKMTMDPAMMEAMMKAGAPGASHKALDALVGTWDTKVTMWMMPGMDPMSSNGVSENRWIMGGRYLEQRYSGNVMGAPFEGIGYTGYDNVKKQYWGTWIDNMSTGVMVSTGTGADAKSMSFTSMMADPMTGQDQKMDEKVTVVDADHHMMEMWAPGPDGKMFKTMEITYSRKK